jgi:hypothetical protein
MSTAAVRTVYAIIYRGRPKRTPNRTTLRCPSTLLSPAQRVRLFLRRRRCWSLSLGISNNENPGLKFRLESLFLLRNTVNKGALGGQRVRALGGQTVRALGGQRVRALGGKKVQELGGQRVRALGGQQVRALGGQRVRALGGQRVQALGGQSVRALGGQKVRALGEQSVQALGGQRGVRQPPAASRQPPATIQIAPVVVYTSTSNFLTGNVSIM